MQPPPSDDTPAEPVAAREHTSATAFDGPPTPPPVRRRRRRRRLLGAAALLGFVGLLGSVAVVGLMSGPSRDGATADISAAPDDERGAPEASDGPPSNAGDPDDDAAGPDGAPSDGPTPPDLGSLDGSDAVYGDLLQQIDRSEHVMLAFQEAIESVFTTPPDDQDIFAALQAVGAEHRDTLLEVRSELVARLPIAGAEEVRARYLEHLDSWADLMDAVAEDPSVLGGEGADAGYTVVINATADAFVRALEERMPEDLDGRVRAYAEDILDRGFRSSFDAQV